MRNRIRSISRVTLLAAFSVAIAALVATPGAMSAKGGGGQRCAGLAGVECPGSLVCVDDPTDDCWPTKGDTDCVGVCQPPRGPRQQVSAVSEVPTVEDSGIATATAVPEFDVLDESAACATSDAELTAAAPGRGKGCKPCKKDRRWCGCTYNGLPRASCDPCCYANDIGVLVCLD